MLTLAMFVGGLIALVAGAELLVRGASRMALALGIAPLVVGLTIVAFGTSAPEVAVSVGAVLQGQTQMAIGNVVGSNIFNVLFILGLSALITPLAVHLQVIRQEVPILIGSSVLLLVLSLDGTVGLFDGALLLGLLLAYTVFLIVQSRSAGSDTNDYDREAPAPGGWDARLPVQIAMIVAGLALLVLGAQWLVDAAVVFARALGVSELVIGLTIVAAGTSMPEVATSVMAAIKGERDIAVGNVVGSCTFNILGCLGLSGMVAGAQGVPVPPALLAFDLWVMLATTLACLPIFLSGREIARWEGLVFLGYYAAYVAYLILAAQQHATLPAFSSAMLGFVIPLTLVTLVVSLIRRPAGTGPG
ncbi:calcium/sodium antiporter [Acidovorax lacteus]